MEHLEQPIATDPAGTTPRVPSLLWHMLGRSPAPMTMRQLCEATGWQSDAVISTISKLRNRLLIRRVGPRSGHALYVLTDKGRDRALCVDIEQVAFAAPGVACCPHCGAQVERGAAP